MDKLFPSKKPHLLVSNDPRTLIGCTAIVKRGWRLGSIALLLGPPDKQTSENSPKFYFLDRVVAAESTVEWQAGQDAAFATQRAESAAKRAAAKAEMEATQRATVTPPTMIRKIRAVVDRFLWSPRLARGVSDAPFYVSNVLQPEHECGEQLVLLRDVTAIQDGHRHADYIWLRAGSVWSEGLNIDDTISLEVIHTQRPYLVVDRLPSNSELRHQLQGRLNGWLRSQHIPSCYADHWHHPSNVINHGRLGNVDVEGFKRLLSECGYHRERVAQTMTGAFMTSSVCKRLACSLDELNYWAATDRLPPDGTKMLVIDGRRINGRCWLPATIEAAKPMIDTWRANDRAAGLPFDARKAAQAERDAKEAAWEATKAERAAVRYRHEAEQKRVAHEIAVKCLRPTAGAN